MNLRFFTYTRAPQSATCERPNSTLLQPRTFLLQDDEHN